MALYLISRPGYVAPGAVESMVVNADSVDHAFALSALVFPQNEVGQQERWEWGTKFVRDIERIGMSHPADRPAGVLVVSRKVAVSKDERS